MLKTALVAFLALFFTISGINHFLNPLILEEYAEKRQLLKPSIMVKLSGLLLVVCGPALLIPVKEIKIVAACSLGIFVLIAAFLIHSFWKEEEKTVKMLETQNFIKNIVIFVEMFYLASTF